MWPLLYWLFLLCEWRRNKLGWLTRSRKTSVIAVIKTGKKNVVLRNAAGAQLKGATMSSKKKSIVPLLVVVSPPSDARLQFVSDRHVEDHHDPPAVHRVDLQFAIAHLADDPLSGSHLCVDGLRRDALFAIDLALHDGPIIPPSAIMIVAIETVLVEITSILKKRSCLLVTKNRPLFLACRLVRS